jgi:hypothetical protein
MELWVAFGVMVGVALAIALFAVTVGRWSDQRWLQRKDARRHARQLEWLRRKQAGEPIPVRYETRYRGTEMVDEDIARMAELGYYVAEQWVLAGGARRIVYRLEGVSAL